jgi:hypothetical protein
MLDLVYLGLLVFLARRIWTLAIRKNRKPLVWVLLMLVLWFLAGGVGSLFALNRLGLAIPASPSSTLKQQLDAYYAIPQNDLLLILLANTFFAFGGYLIARYILEKKPDPVENSIHTVGSDDLRPPSNR